MNIKTFAIVVISLFASACGGGGGGGGGGDSFPSYSGNDPFVAKIHGQWYGDCFNWQSSETAVESYIIRYSINGNTGSVEVDYFDYAAANCPSNLRIVSEGPRYVATLYSSFTTNKGYTAYPVDLAWNDGEGSGIDEDLVGVVSNQLLFGLETASHTRPTELDETQPYNRSIPENGNGTDASPPQSTPAAGNNAAESNIFGTWKTNCDTYSYNDPNSGTTHYISDETVEIYNSSGLGSFTYTEWTTDGCTGEPNYIESGDFSFVVGDKITTQSGEQAYEIDFTLNNGSQFDIFNVSGDLLRFSAEGSTDSAANRSNQLETDSIFFYYKQN